MNPKKITKFLICFFFSLLVLTLFFTWVRYRVNIVALAKYMLAQAGYSIGVSLNVPENPFNTLAKQLQEKETDLQKREQLLNEIIVKTEKESKIILILILTLIIILFILVLVNFYLDYQARKSHQI